MPSFDESYPGMVTALAARFGTAETRPTATEAFERMVVALLNRQVGAIVKSPEYRDLIEKAGSVALSSTPEELSQILRDTYEQTAGIAREFGLQMD